MSRTALGVARVRAAESARPDRLFDDPYAAGFVAALGDPAASADLDAMTPEQRRWRAGVVVHIIVRTRFFDDYLRDAVTAGCSQVVLLGAGLDTRAWRLGWPTGLRWFELDLPEVLTVKASVLSAAAGCDRTEIATDLSRDWPPSLVAAGFDKNRPTAWLAEGLLIYFDAATAAHVMTRVTELSAAGSRFAAERGDVAGTVASSATDGRLDEAAALWRGGVAGGLVTWLDSRGWQTTTHELREVAASYGRTVPGDPHSGFVTAVR